MNNTRYCNTCTPAGCVCAIEIRPKDLNDEWLDNDNEKDKEDCDSEEAPPAELYWDADIDQALD